MSDDGLRVSIIASLVLVGSLWLLLFIVNGTSNYLWAEGYEITITGTVQIHKLDYNKFWRYKYTKVELLTYSGEDYDLELLGHEELEFGKTYRITYIRVSPLGHHQFLYGKIRNIVEVKPP